MYFLDVSFRWAGVRRDPFFKIFENTFHTKKETAKCVMMMIHSGIDVDRKAILLNVSIFLIPSTDSLQSDLPFTAVCRVLHYIALL
jgi:hypothetical protein